MFCDFFDINDESISLRKFQNKTLNIYNNDSCYIVLRDIADAASFLVRTILDEDPEIESIKVNFEDDFNDFFLISNYFNRKLITITSDNLSFLKNASEFFQISSLMLKIEEFERHFQIMTKNVNITTLETYDSILSNLNEDNYENIAENMTDFKLISTTDADSESDYEIIGSIIFKLICNRYLSAPLFLKFVKLLNNQKISSTIINLAYQIKKDSVKNYIFQIITDTEVSSNLKYYNYGDESIFKRLYNSNHSDDDLDLYDESYANSSELILIQNIEQIRKEIDDYELRNKSQLETNQNDDQKSQKKPLFPFLKKTHENPNEMTLPRFCQICTTLRRNGVNPSAICLSLRNDDVDSFQKICSNDSQFNFGQKVPFSRFESSSMLVQCSLAEYAAYFGSVKCFKHILINYNNGSNFSQSETKIVKYAIAGRNIEIIRLCEQNGCVFCSSALKSCIRFNNQEIFEWIIMNKTKLYGMNMGCTINITGRHYVKQPWFECETCKINSPYGCCLYCATHCHKGHLLINKKLSNAYCDCSLIYDGPHFCKGMTKVIFKENDDQNTHNNENNDQNAHNDTDNRIFGNFGEDEEDNMFFLDDDDDRNQHDDHDADWAPVDDIVHPSYRSSSMVSHLENLSLSQVDYLIFACIRNHNYSMLRRLIELGANLIETSPKFFIMAASTNNLRLAKLAIILGKPKSVNKYVYDDLPYAIGSIPLNSQIKKLGIEAEKMGIISVEKSCCIC